MDECIDFPGEDAVVWTLDANISYWRAEAEKSDRDKIAFTFHHGQ